MKFSTIKKKYKDQWVLLECIKTTEDLHILEAIVLAHTKSKEALYKKEAKLRFISKHPLAVEYTGKYPNDLTIVF